LQLGFILFEGCETNRILVDKARQLLHFRFRKPYYTMSPSSSPKVLVVNDDPGSLIGLVGLLSQWEEEIGFDVISARSGQEALREVLLHDFAVILLDVNMPDMNGFETARAIHARKASASVPIIFVTAYLADEMNRLKGYKHGAADYLFTPIIPEMLKSKVSVFVALAAQRIKLRDQAESLDQRTRELVFTNEQLQAEIDRRKEAEQRTKTSEEFLAMLGHELRNPLAAVSNAATLLGIGGVTRQQETKAVKIIQRQSEQLVRIVDDLLDLGRVMSGKILLAKQPVELSSVVQSCVETLTVSGRTKSHSLDLQVEPAAVYADPARMEQIVTNLIDNALKYTPDGGQIFVRVHVDAEEVILTVQDTGIGISAELLSRIFNVFVQGEQSLDRPKGGLGIGLALVRQLVALHGGTVTAGSNDAGHGSIFVVRLPSHTEQVDEVQPTNFARPGQCSILLIEDSEDGREIMQLLLAAKGHQVLTAADGIEGIEVAARNMPTIALVDIGLPGIDGYEVARRIRALPQTANMKLIALTGYGLENDKAKALEAGFDMHLVKPVSPDRLDEIISYCWNPVATS
jgi:signal transduction histidine kinase